MKFRIIEKIGDVGKEHKSTFYIERKGWFGWYEIKLVELDSTEIPHKTYEDAQKYMYKKYMSGGDCKRYGHIYEFIAYTYYCM